MECHTTLETGSGTKGKRINAKKDSDFNPSVVNSESLVGTAIGVGEWAQGSPVLVQTRVHEEQSISGPAAKRHS